VFAWAFKKHEKMGKGLSENRTKAKKEGICLTAIFCLEFDISYYLSIFLWWITVKDIKSQHFKILIFEYLWVRDF